MIRVLLADDHQMFIDGVKAFLKNERDIQVAGEALNQEQVLAIMEREPVDVVLLDVRFPTDKEGEDTCRALKKKYPQTKVLMLTMHDQPERVKKFFNYNANGYVLKEKSKNELIGAIHAVYKKNSYYPPRLIEAMITGSSSTEEEVHFTPTEMKVLVLTSKGLKDKDIAAELNMSEKTARKHSQNMRKKAGVSNRLELVNFARGRGFI